MTQSLRPEAGQTEEGARSSLLVEGACREGAGRSRNHRMT